MENKGFKIIEKTFRPLNWLERILHYPYNEEYMIAIDHGDFTEVEIGYGKK